MSKIVEEFEAYLRALPDTNESPLICQRTPPRKRPGEVFCLACFYDSGELRFQSFYERQDMRQGCEIHSRVCLNTFYRKPRSDKTLHTLYALWLDIDGDHSNCEPILERFLQLGLKSPTQVICTSPGRFHVILEIAPLRAYPDKVSYWRNIAKKLADAFSDLGCDMAASTNIVGFVRIPGHPNYKYATKPMVKTVFSCPSLFTLREIREALSNRRPAISLHHLAQRIFDQGISQNHRNSAIYSLALHLKCNGYSHDEALDKLTAWNQKLLETLKEKEVQNSVKSAYQGNKSVSRRWLSYLAGQTPEGIEASYRDHKKRIPLTEHVERIKTELSENGNFYGSQREFARKLGIPWSSYRAARKKI